MQKLGLALSGGGFRATLYHLGVVRFLRDAGALQQVTDIASVSGGSILAAHLVLNWDRYNGDDESFAKAASEVVRFVQFDVRNHIVRRIPLQFVLRILARLRLWQRCNLTPNANLERYYKNVLYGDRCLYELPETPALHILTTNVSNGGLSVFNRQGLFIQERGDTDNATFQHIPGQMASLPRVVGASSAFPGFFPPVQISAADLGVREGHFPTEWFTDGGVYDNLGTRAFSWLKRQNVEFDQILVSDAGKPFQVLSDASLGLIGQSMRATDILWDRVSQLEREHFGKQGEFAFLPIIETVDPSEDPTALHPVVQAEVQSIRTDLDRFSAQEVNALAQHGYEVARKVCRKNRTLGDAEIPDAPPWAPIPESDLTTHKVEDARPFQPSGATRLSRQIRKSSRRRVWTTLLDWRDWPSYLYVAIAFVLLFYLPLQVYQLYRKSEMQERIIKAIASGDPDIRQILDLATSDPTVDWISEEVRERPEPTDVSYEGVEVLTHSRIYDLRRWHPHEESLDRQGHVYIRDRITLKLMESYDGDRHVTFQFPSKVENVEFRQPNDELQGIISRISEPVEVQGQKRTIYELEYDLSNVPHEEAVTIEAELLLSHPKIARAPFVTHTKTDLISVWLLFPADRPYRTYNLVSYPVDGKAAPKIMDNRYAIDHPYGSLIGWSVVNPKEDHVYECRWTE
ncbi:patatin-like phospholipase family protein [Planctomycetota bacterium]